MSATLQGATYYVPIPKNEKFVLAALADHANDDGGGVYPGNELIALKTSDSVRNVQRLLATLEEAGLIARVRYARGGRGHAVEWAVNAPLVYEVARANGWTARRKTMSVVSPFRPGKGDTTGVKGDTTGVKGALGVTPTIKNHQNHPELSTDAAPPLLTNLHPRGLDEPIGAYLLRIVDIVRADSP